MNKEIKEFNGVSYELITHESESPLFGDFIKKHGLKIKVDFFPRQKNYCANLNNDVPGHFIWEIKGIMMSGVNSGYGKTEYEAIENLLKRLQNSEKDGIIFQLEDQNNHRTTIYFSDLILK